MKRFVMALTAVMLFTPGCRVVVDGGAGTYDTCDSFDGCASAFDGCVALSTGDQLCTQSCAEDADCPGTGRCLGFDGAAPVCFQTCLSSGICEFGWSCQAVADGGESVCLPDPTTPPPGEPTYDRCATTSQCDDASDECLSVSTAESTDSQCTRGCVDDLDCPGSGHCLDFGGGGTCFETCITSGVCETGWGCTDATDGSSICLPGSGTPDPVGVPAYNECTIGSTNECVASVEGCFTISVDSVSAGVCTSSCSSGSDCPFTAGGLRGACISFDSGASSTCFESCSTSDDCLTNFACKSSLADGTTFPPICLPI